LYYYIAPKAKRRQSHLTRSKVEIATDGWRRANLTYKYDYYYWRQRKSDRREYCQTFAVLQQERLFMKLLLSSQCLLTLLFSIPSKLARQQQNMSSKIIGQHGEERLAPANNKHFRRIIVTTCIYNIIL